MVYFLTIFPCTQGVFLLFFMTICHIQLFPSGFFSKEKGKAISPSLYLFKYLELPVIVSTGTNLHIHSQREGVYPCSGILLLCDPHLCPSIPSPLWASLMAQLVKNLPAVRETWGWSLGWEDFLGREWLPTPVFWPGEFHGLYSP